MKEKIAESIFLALMSLVSATELTFSRQSLQKKLRKMGNIGIDKRSFNRSFGRLNYGNFVKLSGKDNKNYQLTGKGLVRLMSYKLRLKNKKKIDWDGFWRLVIFDIPEEKKIAREALRRKLKYFNFFPLQKSVFAFPFKCEDEINSLAGFFGVDDFLEIVLAKSLGRKEKEARDLFDL